MGKTLMYRKKINENFDFRKFVQLYRRKVVAYFMSKDRGIVRPY